VGLALTSALMMKENLQYAIRETAALESYMTSVERLLEYVNTPSEAPLESKPGQVRSYAIESLTFTCEFTRFLKLLLILTFRIQTCHRLAPERSHSIRISVAFLR